MEHEAMNDYVLILSHRWEYEQEGSLWVKK